MWGLFIILVWCLIYATIKSKKKQKKSELKWAVKASSWYIIPDIPPEYECTCINCWYEIESLMDFWAYRRKCPACKVTNYRVREYTNNHNIKKFHTWSKEEYEVEKQKRNLYFDYVYNYKNLKKEVWAAIYKEIYTKLADFSWLPVKETFDIKNKNIIQKPKLLKLRYYCFAQKIQNLIIKWEYNSADKFFRQNMFIALDWFDIEQAIHIFLSYIFLAGVVYYIKYKYTYKDLGLDFSLTYENFIDDWGLDVFITEFEKLWVHSDEIKKRFWEKYPNFPDWIEFVTQSLSLEGK